MANEIVKVENLKRSGEDYEPSRLVKRKMTHDPQDNGGEQIDIKSSLMKTANGQLVLSVLKLKEGNPMCSCRGCKIGNRRERKRLPAGFVKRIRLWRYLNTVYYTTVRLEQRVSGETLLENSRCRFCADTQSCPLRSHNITSTEPPANENSQKIKEEEKNEMDAFKKTVVKDEKPWLFEVSLHDA
ncbi:hypothetical protein EAE96_010699 [Botrytis aclada]|nr:hypothetical protein EAE96_010699 [Botrytis aclada]